MAIAQKIANGSQQLAQAKKKAITIGSVEVFVTELNQNTDWIKRRRSHLLYKLPALSF